MSICALQIKAFTYKYAEYNTRLQEFLSPVNYVRCVGFSYTQNQALQSPKPILTPTKVDFVTSRHDSIRLATLVIVISVMQCDTFHKSLARAGCHFRVNT